MPKVFVLCARDAAAEIEAVDMKLLLSFEELQQDNETDLVVELIDLYLQDAPVKIDAIQQAIAKTDANSLKHAAHSLKGSSGRSVFDNSHRFVKNLNLSPILG